MRMRYKYVLFDLDGTLTDPKEGITKSFQYALQFFDIQEELLNLLKVIGPPLLDSFMDFYGFTREKAEAAVEKYRERFREKGIYENALYPGVQEMLLDLKSHGAKIALATSKPQLFALQILEHFAIEKYFDVKVGSELDGTRNYKDEVIEEVLCQFGFPNRREVLMVGDRKHDILGAKKCGIDSAGVSFGYAEPGELEAAGADYILHSVKDLQMFLIQEETKDL